MLSIFKFSKILFYQVGGALAKNGYADLLLHDDVWGGKLEEGAMIQYWNNPIKRGDDKKTYDIIDVNQNIYSKLMNV